MSKKPKDPVDIVEQLREEGFITHMGGLSRESKLLHEAADEIERLRKQRDEARRELCAGRRELCRNEAIIRLQRHRVHRDSEDVVGLAKEISVERGWDCFDNLSEIS